MSKKIQMLKPRGQSPLEKMMSWSICRECKKRTRQSALIWVRDEYKILYFECENGHAWFKKRKLTAAEKGGE